MNAILPVIVDVGVGRAVEDWLRSAGCDVRAVRDADKVTAHPALKPAP